MKQLQVLCWAMNPVELRRVCLAPRMTGVGGMVSFQRRLAQGLQSLGIQVAYDLDDDACDAVLVIGGTRHLAQLWRARKRGSLIVQRLDGMNWLHRRLRTGLTHYLRAEYGNLLLAIIRHRLADVIVYQSAFAQKWWERVHGIAPVPRRVVYNGVDLSYYTPDGRHARPRDRYRLLLVEGSLMGGYEIGLEVAVPLAERLSNELNNLSSCPNQDRYPVELMVVGRVADEVKTFWEQRSSIPIKWAGLVPAEQIPEMDRSAHLLYSADVNPACPNAVIEALACGLPVLAYDTGALPEMISGGAGRIVPYGGDPWRLDPPDLPPLVKAAREILQNQDAYRHAARRLAEQVFSLERMVQGYLDAFTIGKGRSN